MKLIKVTLFLFDGEMWSPENGISKSPSVPVGWCRSCKLVFLLAEWRPLKPLCLRIPGFQAKDDWIRVVARHRNGQATQASEKPVSENRKAGGWTKPLSSREKEAESQFVCPEPWSDATCLSSKRRETEFVKGLVYMDHAPLPPPQV